MRTVIADSKPYPAMKDSGVPWLGEVPTHWEVLPNHAFFDEVKERDHPEEPMLSVTITKGVIRQRELLADSSKKDNSNQDKSAYKLVRPGDIAYNKMRAWQGAVGVSDYHGIVSPAYVVERPREGASSRYLHYLLRTPAFAKEAERWSYGITSDMWSLRPEHFKMIYGCLPPLSEQAAIVRFLDHADRRIRRYIRAKQKLIALLEEQKQALIQQSVTGQIDVRTGLPYPAYKPSGVEWLGDVPEHWEVRRLKSKLRPVDRRSSSGAETLLSLRRDLGVVVYAEHFSRPPQGATLVGYKLVEAGQLVINRLQANNGLLFCSGLSGVVSPDYSVFAPRSPVDMEYLGNLLRTVTYKAHFRRESTGLGTGSAGFLRLYDDRLLATPVALPPLEEQSTLLVSLSEITASLCRAIGRQHVEIGLLREYRTRLIADVVTGKLDVRESAAGLPEVDPLADEFDAPTQSTETGVVELNDTTEFPEEFAMENEVII